MHRNEHTIEIARPPATVFPYLTEPERLKRWVGGLTTFEAAKGESAHVGAQSHQVMAIRGREWKLVDLSFQGRSRTSKRTVPI